MMAQGDYLVGGSGVGHGRCDTARKGVTFLEHRTFGIAAHWLEGHKGAIDMRKEAFRMRIALLVLGGTLALATVTVAGAAEVNCKQVNKYLQTGRSVKDVAETMVVSESDVEKCKAEGGGDTKAGEAKPGEAKPSGGTGAH
jgi:hypothetical protein